MKPSAPAVNRDFFLPELCRAEALLGLILLAELLVLAWSLADGGSPGFNWSGFALASLFVQWVLLLTAGLLCLLRNRLMHLNALHASLLTCLLALLVTLACTAGGHWLNLLPARDLQAAGVLTPYVRYGMISLILSAIAVRTLYIQSESRRRQQAELQARLQALQASIRPHFLFNSLNSIANLTAINPEKAEAALLDLSGLFRAVLAQADRLSNWAQEQELAQRYLALEQLRMGDRLQIAWDISGIPDTLPMPHLTLQPLVENAVIHGIQPNLEGGRIDIHAHLHNNSLQLEIRNPVAAQQPLHKGSGTALNNIRLRLAALLGPHARLHTRREQDVFITQIQYPNPQTSQQADE